MDSVKEGATRAQFESELVATYEKIKAIEDDEIPKLQKERDVLESRYQAATKDLVLNWEN